MDIKKNIIPVILTCAYSMTILAQGIATPIGFATISSLTLGAGLLYTLNRRIQEGRGPIPLAVLSMPVVVASICYYLLGVSSIMFADQTFLCIKEMVQRFLIIMLPTLVFSLTPKKPDDLKFALLSYLPICGFVALVALYDAHHLGFAKPAFTLGMHKNHIAGSCSVMATIAVAAMLTSNEHKKRMKMLVFLALGILGCVATQGRAGMVCIVVASALMLIAARAKVRNIAYFFLSILLVGLVLWKALPQEAMEHVVSTKKFSTNEIRMSLWTDVVPELIKDPWSPVGWGNPLIKNDKQYGDCANVLLFDWMQMSLLGPVLLLTIIFFAIKLPLDNARRMPTKGLLPFINLVALGVIAGRFTHGMLDTFWIGRGVTLVTWASIGIAIFVKLYLDQLAVSNKRNLKASSATNLVRARS